MFHKYILGSITLTGEAAGDISMQRWILDPVGMNQDKVKIILLECEILVSVWQILGSPEDVGHQQYRGHLLELLIHY